MASNALRVVVFAFTITVAVAIDYIVIDPGNGNKGIIDASFDPNTSSAGRIQTALLNLPRGYYLYNSGWVKLREKTYWHYLADYLIAQRHRNREAMNYYADKMRTAPQS